MTLKELKKYVDAALLVYSGKSEVFVIVGEADAREARGRDVEKASLDFDNGGPVFLLEVERP